MRLCSLIAGFAASITVAGPSAAQVPHREEQAIVVTGSRDTERQVRDFVGALTQASPRGQIGRFEQKLCPAAFGVGVDQQAEIERRLRMVATEAGIPVGEPDCAPNSILMVTSTKGPFLKELRRARPEYFGGLTIRAFQQLVRAAGPTASWQLEYKVDARGVPVSSNGDEPMVNRTIYPGSLITAADRPVFEAAALVVEGSALDGLTTTQVADYAAMRLFARTDPQRLAGSAAPTILGILDAPMGTAVPPTLTQWDMSFLRGLYASPNNLYSAAQRSSVGRQILKDLEHAGDKGKSATPQ